MLENHIRGLKAVGVPSPSKARVAIIRDWSELRQLWETGAPWRNVVTTAAETLQSAARRPEHAHLLRAPIWPTGSPRVIGVIVIAKTERLDECPVHADREVAWKTLCFLEQVLDYQLLATVLDAPCVEAFSSLIGASVEGFIPFGWIGDEFRFLAVPTVEDTSLSAPT